MPDFCKDHRVTPRDPAQPPPQASGLAAAAARVGDRWSMQVVDALLGGPLRFGELQDALPGAAPSVLSARLKSLEVDGLVVALPYQHRPPRFAYQLTEAGAELAGALRLLSHWGARHADGATPVHGACGTPLEARWFCPTCGVVVDDPSHDDTHFV